MPKFKYSVATNSIAKAINPIILKLTYPEHVPNITALHDAQFGEYGSPSTMVTMVGQNPPSPTAPPTPLVGKKTFERPWG